jgi:Ala-tRNA(Pro) deacylase
MTILNFIIDKLTTGNIAYSLINHKPTFTSEESAAVRNEPIENGAKALLLKADDTFLLVVMSAAKQLDSKKAKVALSAKKIRFATKDELLELTGLVPGSVPPFGEPILPFLLFIDDSILNLERVAFNAGSLENSIKMSRVDYVNFAKGIAVNLSV